MITVYGASDDLIEVEGDISEEFTYQSTGSEGDYLAFSDGTILRIVATDECDGMWRITPIVTGPGFQGITQATTEGTEYSDFAKVEALWVVHGTGYAKR